MEIGKTNGLSMQRIKIRCLECWIAMTGQVAVALIVCHDQNHIGAFLRFSLQAFGGDHRDRNQPNNKERSTTSEELHKAIIVKVDAIDFAFAGLDHGCTLRNGVCTSPATGSCTYACK